MDLLNPSLSQAGQNKILTAEQLKQQQDLANLLQKEGQNASGQKFTSPWQVAGQWAQALAGKYKQQQVNQGYADLNAMSTPGQPAPSPAQPAAIPGQSPAAPDAAPNNMPWSGNVSDAGTQMPDMSSSLTG